MRKQKVSFTQEDLLKASEYAKGKKVISVKELSDKFNKSQDWAVEVLDILQELGYVEEYK